MKLGVFVSDYKIPVDTLDRMKADSLGIVLVLNGVYHAVIKEGGKESALLGKSPKIYALSEDLLTRGLSPEQVDKRVKVVDYNGLADVIFNDFEKVAWL
ncbi:MAG: DsrH/TusB family sulfur metabolism protein [Nitrospiraceae bacterium]|nr:DsrH/TusB family sulfur metabolism protein [Nitrospiraceae bacterium]